MEPLGDPSLAALPPPPSVPWIRLYYFEIYKDVSMQGALFVWLL